MDPCTKQEDIEHIKQSVQRIEQALLGDKFNPEGFIQRFNKLEKKVDKTERKIWYYTALVAGVLTGLSFFLNHLFKLL